MKTFGEFFENLRRRIEKTGRTDSQCGDMDAYKAEHRTESVLHLDREDEGWKIIADQELSHHTLREFSVAMLRAGVRRLAQEVNRDNFKPEHFSWALNSVHEFYYAMLEEARRCGLNAEPLVEARP